MILVKKTGTECISQVQELAEKTWAVAYASILPPLQMSYMLDLFYSTSALQNQMLEGHQFILATDNHEAVGFASYSPKAEADFHSPDYSEKTPEVPSHVYRLHKIYIDPTVQGKGVGKILLNFLICDIKQMGATAIELNVNRFNKALGFYLKYGFEIMREEDIDIGNGYFMNDYVMNLGLT